MTGITNLSTTNQSIVNTDFDMRKVSAEVSGVEVADVDAKVADVAPSLIRSTVTVLFSPIFMLARLIHRVAMAIYQFFASAFYSVYALFSVPTTVINQLKELPLALTLALENTKQKNLVLEEKTYSTPSELVESVIPDTKEEQIPDSTEVEPPSALTLAIRNAKLKKVALKEREATVDDDLLKMLQTRRGGIERTDEKEKVKKNILQPTQTLPSNVVPIVTPTPISGDIKRVTAEELQSIQLRKVNRQKISEEKEQQKANEISKNTNSVQIQKMFAIVESNNEAISEENSYWA